MKQIYNLIHLGKNIEALNLINAEIELETENDELYYLRGKIHQRMHNWKEAIENYQQAVFLNKQSPATEALKYINNILSFYNKDIYNQ